MSKKNNELKTSNKSGLGASRRAWYKSAALPWAIIGIVVIASSSFIAGWHLSLNHSNDLQSQVERRASQIVDLSKDEQ